MILDRVRRLIHLFERSRRLSVLRVSTLFALILVLVGPLKAQASSEVYYFVTEEDRSFIYVLLFFISIITIASLVSVFVIKLKSRKNSVILNEAYTRLREENAEHKMSDAIIEALSTRYDLICYVDASRNTIKLYQISGIFAGIIGEGVESIEPRSFDSILRKLILPEDFDIFLQATDRVRSITQIREFNKVVSHEFRIITSDGIRYYKINIAGDADYKDGFIIGFADIDEHVRQSKADREFKEEQELNIKDSIRVLSNEQDSSSAIEQLLGILLKHYKADRTYVFEYTDGDSVISNTYEVDAWGAKPVCKDILAVPREALGEWEHLFEFKNDIRRIHVKNSISEENFIREILDSAGVDDIIATPISSKEKIVGFLGVDNPKANESDSFFINAMSAFVYREILQRNQYDEEHSIQSTLFNSFLLIAMINMNNGECKMYLEKTEHEKTLGGKRESYQDFVSKIIRNFVDHADESVVREKMAIENVIDHLERSRNGQYTFVITDYSGGKTRYLEILYMRPNLDSSSVIVTCADRTEELEKERLVQLQLEEERDRAEKASAAKSRFLSNMSHDIRTPINGIIGMIDIAINHIDEKERVLDSLAKLKDSSDHLFHLLNDVLDMSKIESGKVEVNLGPMNVLRMAQNCYSITVGGCQKKHITVVKNFDELRYPNVFGDERQIMQILVNILGNATKFTGMGGKIIFSISEEIVEAPETGSDIISNLTFRIKDNGRGMSEEFLQKIWDPFVQEECNKARTDAAGTGLGMPICKNLTELMGGRISVESKLGEGSEFTVVLPLRVNPHEVVQAVKSRKVNLIGRNVMLVEDNELNQEVAREILESLGLKVTSAFDGVEAVKKFIESPVDFYDAILMDIMMVEMDGLEATRQIRKLEREDATTVPIIAMTANAFSDDRKKTREAGMNAHITKPIEKDLLIETLSEFINE